MLAPFLFSFPAKTIKNTSLHTTEWPSWDSDHFGLDQCQYPCVSSIPAEKCVSSGSERSVCHLPWKSRNSSSPCNCEIPMNNQTGWKGNWDNERMLLCVFAPWSWFCVHSDGDGVLRRRRGRVLHDPDDVRLHQQPFPDLVRSASDVRQQGRRPRSVRTICFCPSKEPGTQGWPRKEGCALEGVNLWNLCKKQVYLELCSQFGRPCQSDFAGGELNEFYQSLHLSLKIAQTCSCFVRGCEKDSCHARRNFCVRWTFFRFIV